MSDKSPASQGEKPAAQTVDREAKREAEVSKRRREIEKDIRETLESKQDAPIERIPTKPGWYVCGVQRAKDGQLPPRDVIHLGGVTFMRIACDENPTVKSDSVEFNQERQGQRQYLDDEDLRNLKAAAGKKIVRVRSRANGSYALISKSQRGAQRTLKGDKPLEAFLYIIPSEAPPETDERGVVAEREPENPSLA